ncbi:MAG TPA: ABC transporter permease, partial [Bryobacteraceae bacterium]|nr:ABC transporter permease [Bryobacteraceae bacterium]
MRILRWLHWRTDRELDEEIEAHLDSEIQSNLERGLSPEEARFAALRAMGNRTQLKERIREADPLRWLEPVAKDVRYAIRGLARNPGFTAVVVLTLALGIGANTAIFSVADAVWFAPLPYPDSNRVMWVTNINMRFNNDEIVAGPDYYDWHKQARSFEAMMAYTEGRPTLTIKDFSGRVLMSRVTSDFWTITGVRPILGRAFGPEEFNAAVLSYELFQKRFHGDPHVIGRTAAFDGHPVTVAGVMPKSFQFVSPAEAVYARSLKSWSIDVYMPMDAASLASETRSGPMTALNVIGRVKPGVSVEAARAEIQGIQTRIATQNPAFYKNLKLNVTPLRDKLAEGAKPALLVLLGAVGFVLLIACANVASLLLARAASRQKEISIRAALGAGRMRILRQSLTESLILALLGGSAGLIVARWGIAAIVRLGPPDVPRLQNSSINGWVLGFTLTVSLATGLLFGLGPALSTSATDLQEALKENGRTLTSSITARRIRGLLAAGEVALALVLLTGAGLMIKSFWRMNESPPGFDPSRTLVAMIPNSSQHYRDLPAGEAYNREILRRIQSAPGVVAAGMGGALQVGVVNRDGVPPFPPGQGPLATFHTVSAGYLHALGMRLVKGRWMTGDERTNVVMMNEAAARRVFGDEDPVGKRIRVPGPPAGRGPVPYTAATVVGITA